MTSIVSILSFCPLTTRAQIPNPQIQQMHFLSDSVQTPSIPHSFGIFLHLAPPFPRNPHQGAVFMHRLSATAEPSTLTCEETRNTRPPASSVASAGLHLQCLPPAVSGWLLEWLLRPPNVNHSTLSHHHLTASPPRSLTS